jgi:diguanylate cyclase (GGDEF)-like protein/PAS domain S-box-containing protein
MGFSPEFFEKLLHICPEGVIGNDSNGNILFFNSSAERLLGYSRDEAIGRVNVSSIYPTGGAREVKDFLYSDEFGGRGRLVDFETEVIRKDGQRIPIRLSCALLHENEKEVGIVGFFSDISARKAIEQEFQESEKRFRGIVETASDGIFSFDGSHKILIANRAGEEMLEYETGELAGTDFRRLIPLKYSGSWEEIERYTRSEDLSVAGKSVEISLSGKTGREIQVQISVAEKLSDGKKVFTAIARDISSRKAVEEELRLLSITDTLTRLYNRRHFHTLARKELDRARRTKVVFSFLLVDIDHFKKYNDAYGHPEGDRVLAEIGELMLKNFRTMDSCFRLGGEEFLVLLPESGVVGAMVAAERLRIRFSELEFTPVNGGGPVTLTVSIGISEYHEGDTTEDMVRYADLAMYTAKNEGRNRTVSHEFLRRRLPRFSDPAR